LNTINVFIEVKKNETASASLKVKEMFLPIQAKLHYLKAYLQKQRV
jgi:hypothetical protein